MTQQEVQQLKGHIVMTAKYFSQNLEDEVVQMYAADLEDLPFDQVITAITRLRRDPKTARFPLPAKIRALIDQKDSPIDAARLAASEIWGSIAKCGSHNSTRARESMGSLAWETVRRFGGWSSVCETSNTADAGVMKAQLRDLAESLYRRAAAGKLEQHVALPEPDSKVTQLVGSVLKQLPGGN